MNTIYIFIYRMNIYEYIYIYIIKNLNCRRLGLNYTVLRHQRLKKLTSFNNSTLNKRIFRKL